MNSKIKRTVAVATIAATAFTGGAAAEARTRGLAPRARYELTHFVGNGVSERLAPKALVMIGCVTEDDFGAGLRVVDYAHDETILRCRQH